MLSRANVPSLLLSGNSGKREQYGAGDDTGPSGTARAGFQGRCTADDGNRDQCYAKSGEQGRCESMSEGKKVHPNHEDHPGRGQHRLVQQPHEHLSANRYGDHLPDD